jgi:hypothetical protein
MYCVRFKGGDCSVGYIRPWNAVRDSETYSATYLPTSFIDGIVHENGLSGKILRHKLRFKGMVNEFFRSECSYGYIKPCDRKTKNPYKYGKKRGETTSKLHVLTQPEIILGFERLEDAEEMAKNYIYVGQTQYIIYPVTFDDARDDIIVEMNDDEFSNLYGTETFESNEGDDEAVYCGNNRQRNNEEMYIRIVRTK